MKYASVCIDRPVGPYEYAIPDELELSIFIGSMVDVHFGNKRVHGVVVDIYDDKKYDGHIKSICGVSPLLPISRDLINLHRWISKYYGCGLGESLVGSIPTRIRNTASKRSKNNGSTKKIKEVFAKIERVQLTDEQEHALKIIRDGGNKPTLLWGVTGSGKTLVYIQIIKEIFQDHEKQALILLPEISLTPQIAARFKNEFPECAVWHSGLTDKQRLDTWFGVMSGSIKVLVGARSALFAPFKNLGVIICDEEHDGSYKQESKPRYHARDSAVKYANQLKIPIILGSATPSIESYHNAKLGKYALARLNNRPSGSCLPTCKIIDMRKECMENGGKVEVSHQIIRGIQARIIKNEQSIILLNRRGYNIQIACNECEWTASCPQCSIGMTFHKTDNSLRCHYCGHKANKPSICPICRSRSFHQSGMGTQKLADHITSKIPSIRIARIDTDTITSNDVLIDILEKFRNKEFDVIVGTQMVSKGLNFPDVTLVGVIGADRGLSMPDYNAGEKTYQLISQVMGRAGRSDKPGEVYLQAWNVEDEVLSLASQHKTEVFLENELELRKSYQYPPFGSMIRFMWTGKDDYKVIDKAEYTIQKSLMFLDNDSRVDGPFPCAIEKINGEFRFHAIYRFPSKIHSQNFMTNIERENLMYGSHTGVSVIDVDPVHVS